MQTCQRFLSTLLIKAIVGTTPWKRRVAMSSFWPPRGPGGNDEVVLVWSVFFVD